MSLTLGDINRTRNIDGLVYYLYYIIDHKDSIKNLTKEIASRVDIPGTAE